MATSALAASKKNEPVQDFRYEIKQELISSTSGELLLRVYSFDKKPFVAAERSKKNAVHACIYKGIPECESRQGSGKKPLIQGSVVDPNQKAFLDKFFMDGGEYMRFVTITHEAETTTVKVGKEYKVGVKVAVRYNDLRRYLEENKVIRSLTTGF